MSRGKSVENKKKAARVAEGAPAPGFARSMGENIGRFFRTLFPLSFMIFMFWGISYLLWRGVPAQASLSGESHGIEGEKSHLSSRTILQAVLKKPRPQWISKEDFEQTANLGIFAANHSIFEPSLSRSLAEKYETSTWVEHVQSVRLVYPALMEVEIDWRKPMARVDRSSMVLDRQGVVLNLMSDSPAVRDVPLIAGVLSLRVDAGKKVPEKDLLDALELINVVRDALSASPGNLKVASVQREPSGMWRVVTDMGPSIYWGAFTDDPPMDEPKTQEKAILLRRRLCGCKDPRLLEYIKVYHPTAPFKPRTATSPNDSVSAEPLPIVHGPQAAAGRLRHTP